MESLPTELRRDVSNAGRQWAVCSAVLRSMGSAVHILIIHGIWHAQPSISLAAKQQIGIKNYEWSLMSLHFYIFGKEHPFTNFNSYLNSPECQKCQKHYPTTAFSNHRQDWKLTQGCSHMIRIIGVAYVVSTFEVRLCGSQVCVACVHANCL